jgi:hypothetical protein
MEPTKMSCSFAEPEQETSQRLDAIYVDRYLVSSFAKFGGEADLI